MIRIHPTADVSPRAQIADGAQIWHQAQVREGASIGRNCIVGKGVYIDFDVSIGDNCKLQNGAFIYHGATLEEGVFVGPGAILTNDRQPRAINPDGSLKAADDWQVGPIQIGYGASIGAPARLAGYVCSCGARLATEQSATGLRGRCAACNREFDLT